MGGPNTAETYVLIANTSPAAADAIVTLFFEDGTSTSRNVPLPGSSRTNVAVGAMFPSALGKRFAVLVDSPTAGPIPMVGETVDVPDVGELLVLRLGRSPLPGDQRTCVFLEQLVRSEPSLVG